MSRNISKEKREKLLAKINQLRNYLRNANDGNEMTAYLTELEKELKRQKFGLVFEEHKEEIDELLETHTPVLKEDKDLFINNGGQVNFLIEGDNLAALTLLEKTHKGKIDVIYIDPPYNQGGDFRYNNEIIGKDDLFKHSKWLSFMKNRLKIAKKLLSRVGVLFISIDDYEITPAKMLLEDIFIESNTEIMVWRKSGDSRDGKMKNTTSFRTDHEYILVAYRNKKHLNKLYEKPNFINNYPNSDNDPRGCYKAGSISRKEEASNPNSPNYYTVTSPSGKSFTRQFDLSKEEFNKLNNDVLVNCDGKRVSRIYWGKNDAAVPAIKIFVDEERFITPSSMLLNKGTTTDGTEELNLLLNGDFTNMRPKPTLLIKTLVQLGSRKNSIVLDFFAGTGTTGQAVFEQNARDKGNRKFILCTNNENDICRDVTYGRIKTIITGKRKDGSKYSEPVKASLKYQKIEFLPTAEQTYYDYANELLKHIKELVELENAINFNGNTELEILLTEDEVEKFFKKVTKLSQVKTIYLGHDISLDLAQQKLLQNNNIAVNIIPEYYYKEKQT
jgi:adenine-specific DNA-methyltransferase